MNRIILPAMLAVTMLAGNAWAQKGGGSTTFYNSGGQNIGRATTSGSTTFRDN